jgi:hypothetical protein
VKTEIDIIGDVSTRFSSLRIPYMLTGSMAMNYYAEPRMTRDIDMVVAIAPGEAAPVAAAFEDDYYVERRAVEEAVAHASMFNLLHRESVIKVDCIIRKESEYRRLEFERRHAVEIEGLSTFIVSKEDLILSKLDWAKDSHSEFQLRDVRNLLATGYDHDHVKTWAPRLGLEALLREAQDG